jgi:hypothetical protein
MLIGGVLLIVLLICLTGILVTGPVVPKPPRLDLDIAPSSGRLRRDVVHLVDELSPRSYRNTENLGRAADWIGAELEAAGLEGEYQAYETDAGRLRNVIGAHRGVEPDAPALVVGAHYDAFDEFPGADDNASGVAVLMELARTRPQRLVRTDRYFVAFCTEEPPRFRSDEMGSYAFARELQRRGIDVELMIALDLVGYYSDAPGSQRFPLFGLGLLYPDRGDFVAVVGDLSSGNSIRRVKYGMRRTRAIPVHSFRASPRLAPVDLSDHLSFRRLGIPAVQVTDTAFMRYPYYHTAGDTPEKLDYERMASLVTALHGVLWDPSVPPADAAGGS